MTTLDANGRTFDVIGQYHGEPRRLPPCSRPLRGFKSIQIRSQASNAGPPSLNRFAALVLSPPA